MTHGMVAAVRSVALTLILLLVITYVFAIAFKSFTEGTTLHADYFNTVPKACLSLLLHGALPDHASFFDEVFAIDGALGMLVLVFIFTASLTVLNLLVGVLVEVVGVVAAAEKDELAASRSGLLDCYSCWKRQK